MVAHIHKREMFVWGKSSHPMEHPGYICASNYLSKSQEKYILSTASARKEAWISGGFCGDWWWVSLLFFGLGHYFPKIIQVWV